MTTWVEWFRQRRTQLRTEFKRGFLPQVSVSTHLPLAQALGGGIFAGAVVWLIAWLILSYFNVQDAVNKGFLIGNIALLAFWFLPFLVILMTSLIYRHWPYWGLWREFPSTQRWVACATLAFFLTALLDEQAIPLQQGWFKYVAPHLPDTITHLLPKHAHKAHGTKFRHFFTIQEFLLYYWPALTVGLFGLMHWLSRQRKEKVALSKTKRRVGH